MTTSLLGRLTAPVRAPLGRLTVREFRGRYLTAVGRAYPDLRLRVVSSHQVELIEPDGRKLCRESVLDGYQAYREDPQALQVLVDQMVRLVEELRNPTPVRPEELLLILGPESFGQEADEPGGPLQVLRRPFAGDLAVYVVADRADCLSYLTAEHVQEDTGLAEAEVWATAAANTARRGQQVSLTPAKPDAVVAELSAGAASSLLLDEGFFDRPEIAALGTSPAVTVGRTTVIVARSDNPYALGALASVAEDDPDSLSPHVFVRTGQGWSVLQTGEALEPA